MTDPRWPLPVRVAWLGAIAMLAALLRVVTDTAEMLPVDLWGIRVLRPLGPEPLARLVTRLGDPAGFGAATLGAVALVWARRGPVLAVAVLAAVGLAGGTAQVMKWLIGPVRLHYVAFPSAHVSATASLLAAVTLALWPVIAPWLRVAVATLAAALTLVMGWAVIGTTRHTFTEVLGGLLVAWVAIGLVFDLGLAWHRRRMASR